MQNKPENQTLDQPITESESQLDEQPTMGENDVLKPIDFKKKGSLDMKKNPKIVAVLMIVAIILGTGTGFGLYKLTARGGQSVTGGNIEQVAGDNIKTGDVFGSPDASTFKDMAEGYLEAGGLDGEGSHQLLRPGGESQTVYLTSSVTDLDKFVGMEVKIWGETFKAQKAGWLMDVGRVEILNTKAEAPTE